VTPVAGRELSWAADWPQRRIGVKGAHGLDGGIAQQLTASGGHVLDVPATLAACVRLLTTGGGRKTDTTRCPKRSCTTTDG
jgi:hypothetical protein